MNNEKVIKKLMEKTNRDENECIIINAILNNHFLIGHNNKEKIKKDFCEKLNMSDKDADNLYNDCAEVLVKGIFKRDKDK